MPEILNIQELSKIIQYTPVSDNHDLLIKALQDRYPETKFNLILDRGGSTWAAGIIDTNGNRIATSLKDWVDEQLTAGDTALNIWRRHKDTGLIRTEMKGGTLVLAAPYGADPDAFYQLEIDAGSEIASQLLFDPKDTSPPEDRSDLLSGPCWYFSDDKVKVLSLPSYEFKKLVNIKHFLRDLVELEKQNRLAELPEIERKIIHVQEITPGPGGGQINKEVPFLDLCPGWLTRVPHAVRFFQDWHESSAGQAVRLCEHWSIQTSEYTDLKGKKYMTIIPQWASADGGIDLPEIDPDWSASPWITMDALEKFDIQVGYPFAWYFYMLHGNRIQHSAGGVIAQAIREGKMSPLPACDEKILMRWRDDPYGF